MHMADREAGCAQQTLLQITEVPEIPEESISTGADDPGHGLPCSAKGCGHQLTVLGAWQNGWE